MKNTLTLLLLSLAAFASGVSVAGEETTWRLAGVMQGQPNGGFAILEASDGVQAIFRPGERIADAVITTISNDRILLSLNGDTVALMLRGAGHALTADTAAAPGAPATQPVAGRYTVQRLRQLLHNAGSDAALQEGVRALFQLPPTVTVTGINHEPAQAVRGALQRMVEYLSLGRTVSLEFDDGDDQGFVYIYPEG